MRLYVLTRHAESTLNVSRLVNGDPAVDVPLSEVGMAQAQALGEQVGAISLDVCVHTRFGRTRATAEIALDGRNVPLLEVSLLDDVDVGDLEGRTIDDYRAWKRAHTRHDRFPDGESLDDAARRYAEGFQQLLALPYERVLVVCHEIPVRYAINGAAGSDDLDGPAHDIVNATPYLFDEDALSRAAARIRHVVQASAGEKTARRRALRGSTASARRPAR